MLVRKRSIDVWSVRFLLRSAQKEKEREDLLKEIERDEAEQAAAYKGSSFFGRKYVPSEKKTQEIRRRLSADRILGREQADKNPSKCFPKGFQK